MSKFAFEFTTKLYIAHILTDSGHDLSLKGFLGVLGGRGQEESMINQKNLGVGFSF